MQGRTPERGAESILRSTERAEATHRFAHTERVSATAVFRHV